ncbi:MAG: DsbA family protein [Bdellovibrionales bacterium]|nr:DsbA family protein [Bdellovibrionales bacterium]
MAQPTLINKIQRRFGPMGTATAVLSFLIFAVVTACTNESRAKPNFIFKPKAEGASSGPIAKIGNEEITEEMLIGDERLEFVDLNKKIYDFKMERLNKLLEEKLIGAEAKKANMSLPEYIEKKVVGGSIKVSNSEIEKFIDDRRLPRAQIDKDEETKKKVRGQISAFIENEKKQTKVANYVAKLTAGHPVEVYFTKPRFQFNVDISKSPILGSKDAPVTIIEYSDFQCPYCSKAAMTVNQIKKKFGGKVKVVFKHFPLPIHREARPASEASMCVHDQNPDKFWKYHDLLFANQDKFDEASLEKFAKDAGVNVDKFKDCFKSGKFRETVQKDYMDGDKLGVKSTPTFFVNGQLVSGAQPIEVFSDVIEEEIALAKK